MGVSRRVDKGGGAVGVVGAGVDMEGVICVHPQARIPMAESRTTIPASTCFDELHERGFTSLRVIQSASSSGRKYLVQAQEAQRSVFPGDTPTADGWEA
jgi:hypothetical protein